MIAFVPGKTRCFSSLAAGQTSKRAARRYIAAAVWLHTHVSTRPMTFDFLKGPRFPLVFLYTYAILYVRR